MNLPDWDTQTQLILGPIKAHDRQLSVSIGRLKGRWYGIAVDTAKSTKTVNGVLEDHGHQALPPKKTLAEAVLQAERYALSWIEDPSNAIKACECGVIGAKKKR
jgi:hypothetical protein